MSYYRLYSLDKLVLDNWECNDSWFRGDKPWHPKGTKQKGLCIHCWHYDDIENGASVPDCIRDECHDSLRGDECNDLRCKCNRCPACDVRQNMQHQTGSCNVKESVEEFLKRSKVTVISPRSAIGASKSHSDMITRRRSGGRAGFATTRKGSNLAKGKKSKPDEFPGIARIPKVAIEHEWHKNRDNDTYIGHYDKELK